MLLQNLQRLLSFPGRKHGMCLYYLWRELLKSTMYKNLFHLTFYPSSMICPHFVLTRSKEAVLEALASTVTRVRTHFTSLSDSMRVDLSVMPSDLFFFFPPLGSYSMFLPVPGWPLPLSQVLHWVCTSKTPPKLPTDITLPSCATDVLPHFIKIFTVPFSLCRSCSLSLKSRADLQPNTLSTAIPSSSLKTLLSHTYR